mmetsp:Transcript_59820/g.142469  ORF Transcript_59820/g.142469 Transcript_59820/m.142469 type:complete len:794 (-) Transcript_59820:285-2666(-)|eukprot:CAMPEP_0178425680 /NCGR_PEP_ID=MMETSP0689_2-20121128/28846_1 /TAXON_ID=160604 /ORGANISM="Amphidinium massartii, Strain CS-259" /LENGTH=793 /DNA_ID=CAMNT_0020047347 /DNA_START=1 /DNA_END=2382 /DNA_ORIENTATION=+
MPLHTCCSSQQVLGNVSFNDEPPNPGVVVSAYPDAPAGRNPSRNQPEMSTQPFRQDAPDEDLKPGLEPVQTDTTAFSVGDLSRFTERGRFPSDRDFSTSSPSRSNSPARRVLPGDPPPFYVKASAPWGRMTSSTGSWERLQRSLREVAAQHLQRQEELIAQYLLASGSSGQGGPTATESFYRPSTGEFTTAVRDPGTATEKPPAATDDKAHSTISFDGDGPEIAGPWDVRGEVDYDGAQLQSNHSFRSGSPSAGMGQRTGSGLFVNSTPNTDEYCPSTYGQMFPSIVSEKPAFTEDLKAIGRSITNPDLQDNLLQRIRWRWEGLREDWLSRRDKYSRSWLARRVQSRGFEVFCALVILANSACIIRSTDLGMKYLDQSAVRSEQAPLDAAEYVFVAWYTIEMVLKIVAFRQSVFCGRDAGWNIFDMSLVALSITELIFEFYLSGTSGGGDTYKVSTLRFLRVCKVVKILRMFRALRLISELRLMLNCVVESFSNLLWALVLLTFLLCMFSIFFVQGCTTYLQDRTDIFNDQDERTTSAFASVSQGMLALLMATTGGDDWRKYYNLILRTGVINAGVFLFYITFFTIAVWNIVTSIFVDKAMRLAQPDLDNMVIQKQKQDKRDAQDLMRMCHSMNSHARKTGHITSDDFCNYMRDSKFRNFFEARGVNIKDTEMFFKMLSTVAESQDYVDLETFVAGCISLKGVASSMDLHLVDYEIRLMTLAQQRFFEICSEQLDSIKRDMQLAHSDAYLPGVRVPSSPIGSRSRSRSEGDCYRNSLQGAISGSPFAKAKVTF